MLSNGPVTLYRATARIWEFTFAALAMQAGLSVPRLAGLLFWGIPGCFRVLAVFYALTAVLLTQPFWPVLRMEFSSGGASHSRRCVASACAFNAVWLFYLTANRWIASASRVEAFGPPVRLWC